VLETNPEKRWFMDTDIEIVSGEILLRLEESKPISLVELIEEMPKGDRTYTLFLKSLQWLIDEGLVRVEDGLISQRPVSPPLGVENMVSASEPCKRHEELLEVGA
jgi:hypothetical protein